MGSIDPESDIQTETLQREQKEMPLPQTVVPRAAPQPATEQQPPLAAPNDAGALQVETPLVSSTELSYVCILIPRFSDHHLIGDITESLVDWMKQICISYGWRLDAIAVRPGYLQWIMIVPLNSNPAHFMRIVRQHTSQRIFEDFPRFKQMNMSGQFWAPGNFVVAGSQLQAPEAVNQFILQTRRHQGIV